MILMMYLLFTEIWSESVVQAFKVRVPAGNYEQLSYAVCCNCIYLQ